MSTRKKSKKVSSLLREERTIEQLEQRELQELEQLKQEVEESSLQHPLTKITRADIIRSTIGALVGTVGHFAFFYGVELAEKISLTRATILYLLSLLVCFLFMYYSGFRKVKEIRVLRFIPLRVMVIYGVSLVVVALTLFLFGFVEEISSGEMIYKSIATTLLLAVLGASTADILGKG